MLFLALLLGFTRAAAEFPNAWQISDTAASVGSTAFYRTNLISAQSIAATNFGFRFTVNARFLDDFGGSESLGFIYSPGSNRFGVMFDFDANGDLIALFPTNGGPTTVVPLTTNRNGARAYHTHQILYAPATKLATYSFDGAPLLTWTGDGSTGTVGQVLWGATSDAGQGAMNFRLVQFQVNNTNVVVYDAGSAVTNRPIAPLPQARGWTFSGLGAGAATNDVSPDNFWHPAIAIHGANPLVTPWLLPFTDPGASVSLPPADLEGGRFHSLTLKGDGTVAAWGSDASGQTNVPPDATNIIALAAGAAHSLALRADDRAIIGWGDNTFGQLNIPASATNVLTLAARSNHNIALRRDGLVVQWGQNSAITNPPATVTNIVAIAAGHLHNIAARSNGTVATWGFAIGQTNIPATATTIIAVAAGTHNFALRSNGTVVVWGDNSFNQTNVPPSATNVIAIAAGLSHCLALRSNGTVIAWGAGTNDTGVTPRHGQSIVPASATNIVAIAAGDYHSLALRADGAVLAWGAGTNSGASPHFSQSVVPAGLSAINLGIVTNGSVNPSVPGNYTLTYSTTNFLGSVCVTSRTVVVQLTYPSLVALPANASNTVATINGTVNPNGFLTTAWFEWGLGSRFDQTTTPVAVGSGTSPIAINANLAGLTPQLPYRYRLVATNAVGLAARGFDVVFSTPVMGISGANPLTNVWGVPYVEPGIVGTGKVVAVAGGRAHSFALRADGRVTGWGENFYGQTNVPALVNDARAVAAGENHGAAARANGTVVSWGENDLGQTNVSPAAVNVVALSAGEAFTLALRRDGRLAGWGDDFYSQATAPEFVTNIAAIAAGQRHCLALFTSGEMAAWGYNGFGQTVIPDGATNLVAVAAGAGHSLALRADGKVFVWGINSYAQTNLPASVTNVIAIAAGFYHSLALRADGTVVAWGAGTTVGGAPHHGQSIVPASATNVIAIAAGYYHSLAQRADGTVIAWGAGTANTGLFPNLGQAIVPNGLDSLNLAPIVTGAVNVTTSGNYLLTYDAVNPFGGAAIPVTRNVVVGPPPAQALLSSAMVLGNGSFQFTFTNGTPTSFTVLASTNVALPTVNWTVLGPATQISPGVYQFTDSQSTNFPLRFYQVQSP